MVNSDLISAVRRRVSGYTLDYDLPRTPIGAQSILRRRVDARERGTPDFLTTSVLTLMAPCTKVVLDAVLLSLPTTRASH